MKMSQTAAILNEAADRTNDSHDHDELHAAAFVVDQVKRGESEYVDRWIAGLFDMQVVKDVRDGK